MVKTKTFWETLFYTPPATWDDLTKHCLKNCSRQSPDIRKQYRQKCGCMESYLGRDHMIYKNSGWWGVRERQPCDKN